MSETTKPLWQRNLPWILELASIYTSKDPNQINMLQMGEDVQQLTIVMLGDEDWPPEVQAFVDDVAALVLHSLLAVVNRFNGSVERGSLRRLVTQHLSYYQRHCSFLPVSSQGEPP